MNHNIRSCVKTTQGLTDYFDSFVGVKQGCNLSPNLFNIFVNDIPSIFTQSCDPIMLDNLKLNCLYYADDLLLLSNSEKGLQSCLNDLYQYSKKWKLNVNIKKKNLCCLTSQGGN